MVGPNGSGEARGQCAWRRSLVFRAHNRNRGADGSVLVDAFMIVIVPQGIALRDAEIARYRGRCEAPADGRSPLLEGGAPPAQIRALRLRWTEINRPTPAGARCPVRIRWSLRRSVGGQQQLCASTFAVDEGREFGLGHAHGIRVVSVEPLQEFCCGQRVRNVEGQLADDLGWSSGRSPDSVPDREVEAFNASLGERRYLRKQA